MIAHMTFEDLSIKSIMSKDVKTAHSNQTIREVCKIMYHHAIGSIVILQGKDYLATIGDPEPELYRGNKAIGIVTERDIVSCFGSDRALSLRTQISEVMSSPLITVNVSNSLKDAVETMQLRNIRRLAVIDIENNDNMMVGIITDKDILKAVMKTMPIPSSTGESLLADQMQFGYRFIYERFLNDNNFPTGPKPDIR
jgi:CBS domain-containing protein